MRHKKNQAVHNEFMRFLPPIVLPIDGTQRPPAQRWCDTAFVNAFTPL